MSHTPLEENHPRDVARPGMVDCTMRDILLRLDRWISLHRSDLVARLAPGVEIATATGNVPEAARDWFRWHDGVRGPCAGLVLGWRPLAWEEARAAADLAARDPYALEGDWHPGWLPFAASDNGNLLVLDTEGVFLQADAVVEVVRGASTRVRHAPSLAVWLNALVETLEDDCWAPDADGVWSPTPENGDLWNTLVLDHEGYPVRFDPSWEHARIPPRPLDWRDAYAHALAESAVESVWFGTPRGDVALGHLLGASLDTSLARIDAAPTERRAGELSRLAATLRAAGDLRAGEILSRWIACATPFDALEALPTLDLADAALRDALVSRTAAWMRAREAGSVAWSLALGEALAPVDLTAAASVRGWQGRLRSGRMGLDAEVLLVAQTEAKRDPAAAAARVDGVLAAIHGRTIDGALDTFRVHAAVRAALVTGRVDALLRGWTRGNDRRCIDAMTALVREGDAARAAAVPDEVESAWLGDALALHLANLTGRAPDDRARRALDRHTDWEFEHVLDASVHGAVCEVRARHHLRHGDADAARDLRAQHLGALQRAAAETLDACLAQVLETSPGVRPDGADDALATLRRWDQLTPDPFALSTLRRLLPKVLMTDPSAVTSLATSLRDAARRVASSV